MEIKEIIDNAKKNDQSAFNALLDFFWNDVYGFQLKRTENENDAEDIAIQTFYQEVINLRYFQELTYREISEELNEPINNVKVKLLRAKKLLAAIIIK